MGQIIIIPQGEAGAKGIVIGEDVIAYYPFEETENFDVVRDVINNFNGTTARLERKPGYLLQGLPVIRSGDKNFEIDKVLDEIPSTLNFSIEFWLNPAERIKTGEHRTYTVFSKQWVSGMRLYAYFVSRLESLQLHIAYSYIDKSGETRDERAMVTVAQGYVKESEWHRFIMQLSLNESGYSSYGVKMDGYEASTKTMRVVDIPINIALSPRILGGDLTNMKFCTNEPSIPIIVDGLPFPSSDRFGIGGILDEVIVRRNLIVPFDYRYFLSIEVDGKGRVVVDPDEIGFEEGDEVELEAIPD